MGLLDDPLRLRSGRVSQMTASRILQPALLMWLGVNMKFARLACSYRSCIAGATTNSDRMAT